MKKPDFKTVIIEASAGTGKTTRITNEFIGLLGNDNPAQMMKRILAITFSEKAAIEMKSRILEQLYRNILPSLRESQKIEVENAMLKLNISTIHSFCQRLLRRFAFYLKIDPFFQIVDEEQSQLLFYRSFGKVLNSGNAKSMVNELLKEVKLNSLKETLCLFQKSHPYVSSGVPDGNMTARLARMFSMVSEMHLKMKKELSLLDFNDLENMTYALLHEHPESFNVLEDFDEMCNYIFVDEFQDTNIIQWRIIHKFFEEWLAGYGAKADRGESYGVFLVGDKKQSIYKFRGAESGIFEVAKNLMSGCLTEEHLSKNYRSSSGILDFINNLFADISPWTQQKLYPGLNVNVPSKIEIKFTEGEDAKSTEYSWVISKIFELVEKKYPVWNRKDKKLRDIQFKDIAILMRGRAGAKFRLLEKTLKQSGLPFVIVGGIGFYEEPEIILLLAILFCLADPSDVLSCWILSNSVYRDKILVNIGRWREMLATEELTVIFEKILEQTGFLTELSTQQRANVEKFLMVLQEWQHMPLYSVASNMRDLSANYRESKADIFSIHQNAVRVLTVHSAKGLEFPAVFLINIEDGTVVLRDTLLYKRTEEGSPYTYMLKKEAEEKDESLFRNALKEEEIRVLYVALTRACHYLFISGENKTGDSHLWLNMIRGFQDVYPASAVYNYQGFQNKEESVEAVSLVEKGCFLTSYSREMEEESFNYKKMVAGQVIHKVLNNVSTGNIKLVKSDFLNKANFYLVKSGLKNISELESYILGLYEKIISNEEIRDIIEKNIEGRTFTELPFIVEKDGKIYEGFIDRILLQDGCPYIYDYKTETSEVSRYKQQMDIYAEATRQIFKTDRVKRFIVFLSEGSICEI